MLHAVVALALVVTVVAVAYGSAAPQLGVAEFAPAARSQVSAPPTTAGEGPVGGAGGRRATTTSLAATSTPAAADQGSTSGPPTTKVGRARACFGDPPRQTPDPRSPACAATIFEGDNGGATTRGVSATEIRVGLLGVAAANQPRVVAMFEHVNRYFEFYGRRLVPVFGAGAGSATVPATARALAADLAAQDVFAALDYGSTLPPSWFHELARNQVVSVAYGSWQLLADRDLFDPLHPYVWSVYPSVEHVWRNLADFVCTSLAGRPASHGSPAIRNTTRKFGIMAVGFSRVPWVRPLVDALAACGVDAPVVEGNNGSSSVLTGIGKLKALGVTTIICACADSSGSAAFGRIESSVGWLDPELLTPVFYAEARQEWAIQLDMNAAERARLFGLQYYPKVAPPQAQWWLLAGHEVDPAISMVDFNILAPLYEELMVLASGIQAAGPALAADTFGAGLMGTRFANAGAGQDPYYLPSVGFGPGDHSWYDDYALSWWAEGIEPIGSNVDPRQGSWCYLDRGARYSVGEFPVDADGRFFNPAEPCR